MKTIPFLAPIPGRWPRTIPAVLGAALALLAPLRTHAVDCNGFKIWTFNIRYNDGWACISDCENEWYRTVGRIARRDVVESYMKAFTPDIFGLQEVRNPAESAGTRVSQLKEVSRWFPDHDYYARDRGDGEHCAIFYRTTRFVRLDAGTFWMSCFPDVPETKYPLDESAGDPQRITSWVRLLDITTGTSFYVFNGHWSLLGATRLYTAAVVRQRVQQIAGGLPVILLGDFNCSESSDPFKILIGASSYSGSSECPIQPIPVPPLSLPLVNSYRQANPIVSPDEGTYHNFSGGIAGSRVDHVLHSANDFAASAATIRNNSYPGHCNDTSCYPSDHFAVEVRFKILMGNVAVDFRRNEINCESGTALAPFNTLTEGLDTVKSAGTISLVNSTTSVGLTINPSRGPVIITSISGPSVIGK